MNASSAVPSNHRFRNLCVIAFFTVQLLLPLRGCIWGRIENRGYFSWNMYSQRYRCRTRYLLTDRASQLRRIQPKEFFNRDAKAYQVYNLTFLPKFHEYLCHTYEERGMLGTIEAAVECSYNDGPTYALVERRSDICTADNYGVIREPEDGRLEEFTGDR